MSIPVVLPPEWIARLNDLSTRRGMSRSALVRKLLSEVSGATWGCKVYIAERLTRRKEPRFRYRNSANPQPAEQESGPERRQPARRDRRVPSIYTHL